MTRKAKVMVYGLCGAVVLLAALLFGASSYFLKFALEPDEERRTAEYSYGVMYSRYPYLKPWVDSLNARSALRDTFVTMPGGRRQHAMYVRSEEACGKTAVLVHGYNDNAIKMLFLARMYDRDLHYNVLLPDLHGHGLSDGDTIGMGWNDADDVIRWIGLAEELFRTDGFRSAMVVHGVSMGAATVMNVSGREVPEYVNAFIEDCGFTDVWDEFSGQLDEMFGLPPFPLMHLTSALCKLKYGWSFREASPLKSLAHSTKPMLFIHGSEDTYVPFRMLYPLYEAKPEPKEMWVAPGSEHTFAYRDHPEEYTARVRAFLERWNGTSASAE